MKYTTAIILAAGEGLRFKHSIHKSLIQIDSQPAIIHCLKAFSRHPFIKEIILAVNPRNYAGILKEIKQFRIAKVTKIVLGGKRRQDSVLNALSGVSKSANLVLIHDGARPFIDKKTISSVIKKADRVGAAIVGVPVKSTIKKLKVDYLVEKTLNRKNLWEIQTPQVFKKELILEAYRRFGQIEVTDDAMLVEKMKRRVSVVLGSYNNIKITTAEDLFTAREIAKRLKR